MLVCGLGVDATVCAGHEKAVDREAAVASRTSQHTIHLHHLLVHLLNGNGQVVRYNTTCDVSIYLETHAKTLD